ncbi:hypothetical protein ACFL7D_03630 [candidate division KSB1 bacterium]
MFIGHFSIAFAAKRLEPKISLGTLFLSVQLIDLFFPIFVLLGLENVRIDPGNTAFTPLDFYNYPFTHSLAGVFIWSVGLGGIYYLVKKFPKGAFILAAGVFSHWILDLISHGRDLPLSFSNESLVGLGLWNSITGTLLVEGGIFILSIYLYLRITKAKNKKGLYSFWILVILTVFIWLGNLFSPPPPDERSMAFVTLLIWLFIPWGYWIDRNRETIKS